VPQGAPGAKALISLAAYGTAEPVPFVLTFFCVYKDGYMKRSLAGERVKVAQGIAWHQKAAALLDELGEFGETSLDSQGETGCRNRLTSCREHSSCLS